VGEYQNIKITNIERNDPQETSCTLPQDKQEEHCVIVNAHNECMRIQRILKSQRQRGIKYPERMPLSTRTDFRSRLDWGVTFVCPQPTATGPAQRREHPLSASYGAFSFILSILW